jgi:hypothetical protein
MGTIKKTRKLKGVIPPKITDPDAVFEAIRRLREFVKRYPGLREEVMKLREQQQRKELLQNGHTLAYRNQFYSGYHV